ncbi:MAG: PLP-dependent aspartate aminotransferase family protein [Spirochaetaceae bacterium]|jgi:cystathionine gamma-synthase|nr:PLP-dependent aspartate aminotransferase family protein [Spirochaetaceae bacterium]
MKTETILLHGDLSFDPLTGAVSTPIYQSATFRHPALGESTGFDYSRALNPTRSVLERRLALAEHGKYGLAFSSGMGAISSLIKLFQPGDNIIVSADLYGGTYRLFNGYYSKYGFSFSWLDTSDFEQIEKNFSQKTKALFIETPSNPMMKVTDIRRCADFIHERGGFLIVDNTFLSPWLQNPLDFGADFVIHSGTKYLAGHHDTLSGFILHSNDEAEVRLRDAQMSEGAVLSPFDSWLTLRGLKTLALRMDKATRNAELIAGWLRKHPAVEKVFWIGFSDHPQYELSCSQSRGAGSMISFYMKDSGHIPQILKKVSLIMFAESLGGTDSLVTYPVVQTHSAIPETMRLVAGVNDKLLRLSVGIEDPDDLIADLDQAFTRHHPVPAASALE